MYEKCIIYEKNLYIYTFFALQIHLRCNNITRNVIILHFRCKMGKEYRLCYDDSL